MREVRKPILPLSELGVWCQSYPREADARITALEAANAAQSVRIATLLEDNHCIPELEARIKELETQLSEISAAFETETTDGGVRMSTDALLNLEGAIIDIQRTNRADAVSMRTLNRVAKQLAIIASALGDQHE